MPGRVVTALWETAYADGDRAAFDVLYGRHEGALYRFVRRLLGVRLAAEVDEVYQETWFRIVAARESFSPQGASWRTWAFTIAHNLAMDRLRVTGREVAFYAHDEEGDGIDAVRMFRQRLSRNGESTSAQQAAAPSAEISSITASARVRSSRPFKKARLVNSPGCASRAPAAISSPSTFFII